MHTNKCTKCGQDFETKNPKRIVCPECLYLDRAAAPSVSPVVRRSTGPQGGSYGGGGRSHGGGHGGSYGGGGRGPGGPPRGGGYGGGGRGPGGPPRGGGYGGGGRGPGGPPRGGGYGGGGRGPGGPPRGGGYGPPRRGPGGPPRRGPGGPGRGGPPRKHLVPPEQLAEIEKLYKEMLPLPNPDAHVVIGEKMDMQPYRAFFGINLIRAKMKLPQLEYPKRPLAVTEEQLSAVKTLYETYLPVPPIGIHKILAKMLKMDEWRAHVAIGLIRKQMSLPRWNEERDDLPEDMKKELEKAEKEKAKEEKAKAKAEKAKAKEEKAKKSDDSSSEAEETKKEEKPKKKAKAGVAASKAKDAKEAEESEPEEAKEE